MKQEQLEEVVDCNTNRKHQLFEACWRELCGSSTAINLHDPDFLCILLALRFSITKVQAPTESTIHAIMLGIIALGGVETLP